MKKLPGLMVLVVFLLSACGGSDTPKPVLKKIENQSEVPAPPPAPSRFGKMSKAELHEALFKAIGDCSEIDAKEILTYQPDLTANKAITDELGVTSQLTPLQYASEKECPGVVVVLLRAQAPVNFGDARGNNSPLIRAISRAGRAARDLSRQREDFRKKNLERFASSLTTVDLLLDANADVNFPSRAGGAIVTAIFISGDSLETQPAARRLVAKLVDKGARLDVRNFRGQNLLMQAAALGDVELVKFIHERDPGLIAKANLNEGDETAFGYALQEMTYELLHFEGHTAQQIKVADYLLEQGAEQNPAIFYEGQTVNLVHKCSSEGNLNAVRYLLSHKLKITEDDVAYAERKLQECSELAPKGKRAYRCGETRLSQQKKIIELLKNAGA